MILKGRKEIIQLEPRAVGDVLRALGLFTRRLGSAGRGLMLFNDARRKIHDLARRYDVPVCPGRESIVANSVRNHECES